MPSDELPERLRRVSRLGARPARVLPALSAVLSWVVLVAAPGMAWGDVGFQVGPRGGVALDGGNVDPYIGLDVRLSVPSSPLTIEATFDDIFDETQTLYQVGANALYQIPIGGRLVPYAGVGMVVSKFSLKEHTLGVDNDGNRVGLNLLAGARLNLGWVSPFVYVSQGIGEFDFLAAGGGLAFRLHESSAAVAPPDLPRFTVTPYIDSNVAGDVQSGRVGLGMSVTYYVFEHLGLELDAELHGHFFRDEDVADLMPSGVDLNTKATIVFAGVVVPYCVKGLSFGTWCPFATAGAGVIHAVFDGIGIMPGASSFSKTQNDPVLTVGLGIAHAFTRHVGLRVDGRFFHAFVDENAHTGGYFKDYGFLRLSAGVSVGF